MSDSFDNLSFEMDEESQESRFYVYALAYPDGHIFYIGKGVGRRIGIHETEARNGINSHKCNIIRDIWASNQEVLKTKLAFFDTEHEAIRYESSLIDSLEGLSNIVAGRKTLYDLFVSEVDKFYFGASICQSDEDGKPTWSARETGEFFGYTRWDTFHNTIQSAMRQMETSGRDTSKHFCPIFKVVQAKNGKAKTRKIDDYILSRDAFLAIIMTSKLLNPIVGFGKGYIAEQATRAYNSQFKDKSLSHLPLATPEELPTPQKSVWQLEQEEQFRLKHKDQPSLFDQPLEE